MKKTILTAMLFIAFLFVGIQNVSAQYDGDSQNTNISYVGDAEAMNLLTAEIQNIENNPLYSQTNEQHPNYYNLVVRLNFFTAVYEGILTGETVPTSIEIGVVESDVEDELKPQYIDPLLVEINALLAE